MSGSMWFDEGNYHSPCVGGFPEFGAIFMSNSSTIKECLKLKLFGLPAPFSNFVKHVQAGMILFLFEFESRQLHGVFEACSDGAMNISPHAFTSSGKQFPAQVRVTRIWKCRPLAEDEFYESIKENYFTRQKFNFGLSKNQVHDLLALFSLRKLTEQRPQRLIPRSEFAEPTRYSVRETNPVDGGELEMSGKKKHEPNTDGNGASIYLPEDHERYFVRETNSVAGARLEMTGRKKHEPYTDGNRASIYPPEDHGRYSVRKTKAVDGGMLEMSNRTKYEPNTDRIRASIYPPEGHENSFGRSVTVTDEGRLGSNDRVGIIPKADQDFDRVTAKKYSGDSRNKLGPPITHSLGSVPDFDIEQRQARPSNYQDHYLDVRRVSDNILSPPENMLDLDCADENRFRQGFSTRYPESRQSGFRISGFSHKAIPEADSLFQHHHGTHSMLCSMQPQNSGPSSARQKAYSPSGSMIHPTSIPYVPDSPSLHIRGMSCSKSNEHLHLFEEHAPVQDSNAGAFATSVNQISNYHESTFSDSHERDCMSGLPSSELASSRTRAKPFTENESVRIHHHPYTPDVSSFDNGRMPRSRSNNYSYSIRECDGLHNDYAGSFHMYEKESFNHPKSSFPCNMPYSDLASSETKAKHFTRNKDVTSHSLPRPSLPTPSFMESEHGKAINMGVSSYSTSPYYYGHPGTSRDRLDCEVNEGVRSHSLAKPSLTTASFLESEHGKLINTGVSSYSTIPDYHGHPRVSRVELDHEMPQHEMYEPFASKSSLSEGDKQQKQDFVSSMEVQNEDLLKSGLLSSVVDQFLDSIQPSQQKTRNSVFSRLARAPEEVLQDIDDDCSMDTSVNEIMASLQQRQSDWGRTKGVNPAIGHKVANVAPLKFRNKKETTVSSKSLKDHSASIPEDFERKVIPGGNESEDPVAEETPFVNFKRRSELRKTSSDIKIRSCRECPKNDGSLVEQHKRRKLIRPNFSKNELLSENDIKDSTSQNGQVATEESLVSENNTGRQVMTGSRVTCENNHVDPKSVAKCEEEKVGTNQSSLSKSDEDGKVLLGNSVAQELLNSVDNCPMKDESPQNHGSARCSNMQESLKRSAENCGNDVHGESKCAEDDEMKCDMGDVVLSQSVENERLRYQVHGGNIVNDSTHWSSKKEIKRLNSEVADIVSSDVCGTQNQQQFPLGSGLKLPAASSETLGYVNVQELSHAI